MNQIIPIILSVFIFTSCSKDYDSSYIESLDSINKVYLLRSTNSGYCPIKSYSVETSKEIVSLIKEDINIGLSKKFKADFKLNLYHKDLLIGVIDISKDDDVYANLTFREKKYGFKLNDSLKRIIEEASNKPYIDCFGKDINSKFKFYDKHNWLNFDSISVSGFVKLLPVKHINPNYLYVITTVGKAEKNWITIQDIKKLLALIDSEQPAFCITTVKSSHLPVKEESTIGGQVMNLIDSYRFKYQYPYFLTDCSITDKERKKDILDWWQKYNE